MAERTPIPTRPFAIETLITTRCHELGLSKARLVQSAGYKNEAKGIRRLDGLVAGDLEITGGLIQGLPAALKLSPDIISRAIEETRQEIAVRKRRVAEQAEAEWRSSFVPHAIILTERKIPSPMFVVAAIGAERLLRLDFDLNASAVQFAHLARIGMKQKLAEWGRVLPGYGQPVGYVVNYAPDRAVTFDLDEMPQEIFDKAYRVGQVQLLIKGQPVPEGVFTAC
jgi:hypothetical protein